MTVPRSRGTVSAGASSAAAGSVSISTMSRTSRANETPRFSASAPSAARASSLRPIRRGLTFKNSSAFSGSRAAASNTLDQANASKAAAMCRDSAAGKISAARRVTPAAARAQETLVADEARRT